VTEREDSEERDRVKETERLVTAAASEKRLGDLAELIAKSLVASNKSSL
jgi:hypothetical protein